MRMPLMLLLMLLLCQCKLAKAQQKINYFPDSVRIEMPDQQAMVVFEFRQYQKDTAFIRNFPSLFGELLNYIKKSSSSNFASTGPYKIEVRMLPEGFKEILATPGHSGYKALGQRTLISFQKNESPKTLVLVKEKQIVELLPPGWEVHIVAADYKINVYSENFEGLETISKSDFTNASGVLSRDAGMKTIGKKKIRSRIVLTQNSVQQSVVDYIYPGDNLFLTINAGVGIYGDKFYPELSGKIGISFKDRFSRQFIRTSIVFNNLIFAERATEGYSTYVNSFVSLSFERNFNGKFDRPHWAGIGAGLLVRQNGDYFKGRTARFFITHDLGRFDIVPEFYLTEDFKKFAFGMTLRFTF